MPAMRFVARRCPCQAKRMGATDALAKPLKRNAPGRTRTCNQTVMRGMASHVDHHDDEETQSGDKVRQELPSRTMLIRKDNEQSG
jgi:hypothetical protein